MLKQGFFLTSITEGVLKKTHTVVGQEEIIREDEYGIVHTTFLPVTKEIIDETVERHPTLGEVIRDWVVIAESEDKVVVHIVVDDTQADQLKGHVKYLGRSYKEIAQKAKDGDQVCKKVIKEIVFTDWETDNPEKGPERISYRGSLAEWIAAGRPARLSGWHPAHRWFGHEVDTPDEDELYYD